MPSWIWCSGSEHHFRNMKIYEAAINLSQGKALGSPCKCGADLEYKIKHEYANVGGALATYTVTRAARLDPEQLSDNDGYDPFLLLLRNDETGDEVVLPTFWAPDKSGRPRGGQYPPMMRLRDWKELFGKLKSPVS